MDRYEISLWEDYQKSGENFFRERKIAVIGSDSMVRDGVQARALEPNLVEELNGTHTFTFKMYYTYTDNQTGEKYKNPFANYLINERKVKVLWKNKWYDLVIKKCQENSATKSITYICNDLFINELSKQGYNLEFNSDLQNNIGTAEELATEVLKDSTWQYDKNMSTPIIQKTEGPVYEVITEQDFEAVCQSPDGDKITSIQEGKTILVFYDSVVNLQDGAENAKLQFLYASEGYATDINDSLVTNGDCYYIDCKIVRDGDYLKVYEEGQKCFDINTAEGVSEHYRAARLVRSQKTEYDARLDRYVLLCKEKETDRDVYEIATTQYSNPLNIINLISNPSNFTSTAGWIGEGLENWEVYPPFNKDSIISDYTASSLLHVKSKSETEENYIYNTGIQANIKYFETTENEKSNGEFGGIYKGEKFIFRVKGKCAGASGRVYFKNATSIQGNLFEFIKTDTGYSPKGQPIFSINKYTINNEWNEFTLISNKTILAKDIDKYALFIQVSPYPYSTYVYTNYWIEDIQFFKYAVGKTSYDENAVEQRINPGEISLQSAVAPVYKYYYKDLECKTAEELSYIYVGAKENQEQYIPVYNNYEKIGTINEKESNRFNILQSIAESFKAWVKFRIDHEDNGEIKIIDGIPQKFVYFVEEIGIDTGLSFEYGIDLKTISRNIDSDKLATKIIVKANNNEFAKNGFCSIAQSNQNYAKENFIINLDYYTQQGLLDKKQLQKDLYSTQEEYIGYYYWLHKWNQEYDDITDILQIKNIDLVRQQAQKEVYEQYLLAAKQQLENIESDMITLANVSRWDRAELYAQQHADNEKVQALLNSHEEVKNQIVKYEQLLLDLTNTLTTLENYITSLQARQETILTNLFNKHKEFNSKYSTYLMEGTWQDENYIDPDEYFLDGLNIAYTSSRPQLSYTINVLRLSSLDEYSSKVFNLGDICYMQDREFFGYLDDKITPYKEKILVSKISSFFDQPEKDILTIQNYKTRFDDLFQRIAATTQSLQYSEGAFARAAGMINPDGTLSFSVLQDTFDYNENLILNSSNQDVTWDDTGITVTNKFNSADKTKIIAGGIFITNDGGATWKNAIRGDGISTELLTAGRINTSEVYIYDGNSPSFRWDSDGLTAYAKNDNDEVLFNIFVRHDKFGFYGYDGGSTGQTNFVPRTEQEILEKAKFGLTWSGFFMKNKDGKDYIEVSTNNDIVVYANKQKLVQIGRLNTSTEENPDYGIWIRNQKGDNVFVSSSKGETIIGGWTLDNKSFYHEGDANTIGFYSEGKSATILNHEDDYYILAGNSFGVTINGEIYSKAGKLGGWNITDESLYCGRSNDGGHTFSGDYILIKSTGTLSGAGTDQYSRPFSWQIGEGGFKFNSETIGGEGETSCEIKLGPTTINNHYIYTTHLSAGGGSIGGCTIGSGGIWGNGWKLTADGAEITISSLRTADGVAMNPSWEEIKYITKIPALAMKYVLVPTSFEATTTYTVQDGYKTIVWASGTTAVKVAGGWYDGYKTETTTVLKGSSSSEDDTPEEHDI